MHYCIYLRKSRKDDELAQQEDVLMRHETTLFTLAKNKNVAIDKIYREGVVSGDTIASRPVMQQLLNDVEQGIWDGVLVVEIERLARGATIDQGIVAQAFKYSNTKIITPMKTYDPNNEFDEEYFEFGLFMSRREYKSINRRMRAGELAAIQEGKYIRNIPPYGYKRKKLEGQKGFTLEPIPDQADVVRYIFDLYVNGIDGARLGCSKISRRLNAENIPTAKGGQWTVSTILTILRNPVYIGKVKWKSRPRVKKIVNGEIVESRPRAKADDQIIVDGLHEPIIEKTIWDNAQNYLSFNPPNPISEKKVLKNPMSGIMVCEICGRAITRRSYSKNADMLSCSNAECKNVGSYLTYVEEQLLINLKALSEEYRLTVKHYPQLSNNKSNDTLKLKNLNNELKKLQTQSDNIHDLLEQGIYTTQKFLERNKLLQDKINSIQKDIKAIESIPKIADKKTLEEFIINVEHVLDVYSVAPTNEKNELLKNIIKKVLYIKESGGQGHERDFRLTILPKLPNV